MTLLQFVFIEHNKRVSSSCMVPRRPTRVEFRKHTRTYTSTHARTQAHTQVHNHTRRYTSTHAGTQAHRRRHVRFRTSFHVRGATTLCQTRDRLQSRLHRRHRRNRRRCRPYPNAYSSGRWWSDVWQTWPFGIGERERGKRNVLFV